MEDVFKWEVGSDTANNTETKKSETPKTVDMESPALKDILEKNIVREFSIGEVDAAERKRLADATKQFGDLAIPEQAAQQLEFPKLPMVEVRGREDDPARTTELAVVYLPVAGAEAARNINLAAELREQMEEQYPDKKVRVLIMSSVVSLSGGDQAFSYSPVERAMEVAEHYTQALEFTGTKEVMVMGASLGGGMVTSVEAILRDRLGMVEAPLATDEDKDKPKIIGSIILQGGGGMEQSYLEVGKGAMEFMKAEPKAAEIWPSPLDIMNMRKRALQAKAQGEVGEAFRLEDHQKEMERRAKDNVEELLEPAQADKLREIDTQIQEELMKMTLTEGGDEETRQKAVDKNLLDLEGDVTSAYGVDRKKIAALITKRNAMLVPVMKEIFRGADARSPEQKEKNGIKRLIAIMPLIAHETPVEIRQNVRGNIAEVNTEKDQYFPEARLAARREAAETRRRAELRAGEFKGELDKIAADQRRIEDMRRNGKYDAEAEIEEAGIHRRRTEVEGQIRKKAEQFPNAAKHIRATSPGEQHGGSATNIDPKRWVRMIVDITDNFYRGGSTGQRRY